MKISVTFVYKEDDIKTKMVQEQWLQLKMKVFILLWHEGGGINLW